MGDWRERGERDGWLSSITNLGSQPSALEMIDAAACHCQGNRRDFKQRPADSSHLVSLLSVPPASTYYYLSLHSSHISCPLAIPTLPGSTRTETNTEYTLSAQTWPVRCSKNTRNAANNPLIASQTSRESRVRCTSRGWHKLFSSMGALGC